MVRLNPWDPFTAGRRVKPTPDLFLNIAIGGATVSSDTWVFGVSGKAGGRGDGRNIERKLQAERNPRPKSVTADIPSLGPESYLYGDGTTQLDRELRALRAWWVTLSRDTRELLKRPPPKVPAVLEAERWAKFSGAIFGYWQNERLCCPACDLPIPDHLQFRVLTLAPATRFTEDGDPLCRICGGLDMKHWMYEQKRPRCQQCNRHHNKRVRCGEKACQKCGHSHGDRVPCAHPDPFLDNWLCK